MAVLYYARNKYGGMKCSCGSTGLEAGGVWACQCSFDCYGGAMRMAIGNRDWNVHGVSCKREAGGFGFARNEPCDITHVTDTDHHCHELSSLQVETCSFCGVWYPTPQIVSLPLLSVFSNLLISPLFCTVPPPSFLDNSTYECSFLTPCSHISLIQFPSILLLSMARCGLCNSLEKKEEHDVRAAFDFAPKQLLESATIEECVSCFLILEGIYRFEDETWSFEEDVRRVYAQSLTAADESLYLDIYFMNDRPKLALEFFCVDRETRGKRPYQLSLIVRRLRCLLIEYLDYLSLQAPLDVLSRL